MTNMSLYMKMKNYLRLYSFPNEFSFPVSVCVSMREILRIKADLESKGVPYTVARIVYGENENGDFYSYFSLDFNSSEPVRFFEIVKNSELTIV